MQQCLCRILTWPLFLEHEGGQAKISVSHCLSGGVIRKASLWSKWKRSNMLAKNKHANVAYFMWISWIGLSAEDWNNYLWRERTTACQWLRKRAKYVLFLFFPSCLRLFNKKEKKKKSDQAFFFPSVLIPTICIRKIREFPADLLYAAEISGCKLNLSQMQSNFAQKILMLRESTVSFVTWTLCVILA